MLSKKVYVIDKHSGITPTYSIKKISIASNKRDEKKEVQNQNYWKIELRLPFESIFVSIVVHCFNE